MGSGGQGVRRVCGRLGMVAAAVLVGVLGLSPGAAAAGLSGPWEPAGDFPNPKDPVFPPNECRSGHIASLTDRGTIWAIGGSGCWAAHDDIIEGGASGSWRIVEGVDFTGARWAAASARQGPHVFEIGGNLNSGSADLIWRITPDAPTQQGYEYGYSVAGDMPLGLEHAGAAIHGGSIYVLGGNSDFGLRAEVWSAPVTSGGTVGDFRLVQNLPGVRRGHAVVTVRNRIYVLGGSDGTQALAEVLYATMYSDGTVGPWQQGPALPAGVSHGKAVAIGDDIYLVGGTNQSSDKVYYATVDPVSGAPGSWQTDLLPDSRTGGHAVVADGDRIYVVGGSGEPNAISAATSSTPGDYYLLDRYRPQLRYDLQDSFRADSAAMMTDNYQVDSNGDLVRTNKLNDKRGKAIAVAYPDDRKPDLSLGYLGSYGGSAEDVLDAAGTPLEQTVDAVLLHGRPEYRDVVYGRVVPDGLGGKILQYWMFFYYNPKTYFTQGAHEGDWEMVQVHLDPQDQPVEATYAQHGWGERCEWEHVQRTASGRPIVYVAEGSHASYFSSGWHINPGPDGLPADDTANGDGDITIPAVESVDPIPSWMYWPGTWGNSDNSPVGPVGQPKWQDPWAWSYSDDVKDCTEEQTQGVSAGGLDEVALVSPLEAINAERSGEEIEIRYRLRPGPSSGRRSPRLLLTTIDRAGRRVPPMTVRTQIRGAGGTVEMTLPPGRGGYRMYASTETASGVRSEVVRIRTR